MRSGLARRQSGRLAGGAALAVVALLFIGGVGHISPGTTRAVTREAMAGGTAMLPACGTPAGSGITDTNPIVENAGVAGALNQLTEALPQVRDTGSLASFTAVVVYGQDVVYAQSVGCADIG